jgi:hypothetical protein
MDASATHASRLGKTPAFIRTLEMEIEKSTA